MIRHQEKIEDLCILYEVWVVEDDVKYSRTFRTEEELSDGDVEVLDRVITEDINISLQLGKRV